MIDWSDDSDPRVIAAWKEFYRQRDLRHQGRVGPSSGELVAEYIASIKGKIRVCWNKDEEE